MSIECDECKYAGYALDDLYCHAANRVIRNVGVPVWCPVLYTDVCGDATF